jgi:hypothetical protein
MMVCWNSRHSGRAGPWIGETVPSGGEIVFEGGAAAGGGPRGGGAGRAWGERSGFCQGGGAVGALLGGPESGVCARPAAVEPSMAIAAMSALAHAVR